MKPICRFRWILESIADADCPPNYPCIHSPGGATVWTLQQWWQIDDQDWDKGLVSEWREISIEENYCICDVCGKTEIRSRDTSMWTDPVVDNLDGGWESIEIANKHLLHCPDCAQKAKK